MNETTTPTEEVGEEQKPEPKPVKHRATLYSEWKQVPSKGPISYFIVWGVIIKDGEPIEYELLRLFNTEFSRVSVTDFSNYVESGKIKEWKM